MNEKLNVFLFPRPSFNFSFSSWASATLISLLELFLKLFKLILVYSPLVPPSLPSTFSTSSISSSPYLRTSAPPATLPVPPTSHPPTPPSACPVFPSSFRLHGSLPCSFASHSILTSFPAASAHSHTNRMLLLRPSSLPSLNTSPPAFATRSSSFFTSRPV